MLGFCHNSTLILGFILGTKFYNDAQCLITVINHCFHAGFSQLETGCSRLGLARLDCKLQVESRFAPYAFSLPWTTGYLGLNLFLVISEGKTQEYKHVSSVCLHPVRNVPLVKAKGQGAGKGNQTCMAKRERGVKN